MDRRYCAENIQSRVIYGALVSLHTFCCAVTLPFMAIPTRKFSSRCEWASLIFRRPNGTISVKTPRILSLNCCKKNPLDGTWLVGRLMLFVCGDVFLAFELTETDARYGTLFFCRPTAAVALRHDWLRNELGMEDFSINRASISHLSQRTGTFTNYLAMKKLKKAALGYIASNLTHEEVGTLETIFKSMDKDGNGRISVQELDEAISQGNFSENILHDLRALRTDLAITRDQQLDWRDFLASTMDRTIALRENNMRMAFDHFGHTDAEYLTIDDLADIFGGIAQAREVMNVLDTNRDGKVYYEDFRHALVESLDDDDEETEVTESSNHDLIS